MSERRVSPFSPGLVAVLVVVVLAAAGIAWATARATGHASHRRAAAVLGTTSGRQPSPSGAPASRASPQVVAAPPAAAPAAAPVARTVDQASTTVAVPSAPSTRATSSAPAQSTRAASAVRTRHVFVAARARHPLAQGGSARPPAAPLEVQRSQNDAGFVYSADPRQNVATSSITLTRNSPRAVLLEVEGQVEDGGARLSAHVTNGLGRPISFPHGLQVTFHLSREASMASLTASNAAVRSLAPGQDARVSTRAPLASHGTYALSGEVAYRRR